MSAPAKERQDARETQTLDVDTPRLLHVPSLDGIHGLCGTRLRNPKKPPTWGVRPNSCVVCLDLWSGLPFETQFAISEFAKGRS